jgi:antitoxin ParD1/3/4
MPNRNVSRTAEQDLLHTLRAQLRAGTDALDRGDFTEFDDADLDAYLDGLAETAPTR